ncbi:unnamed protein product [Aureobasidium pullulans]|nr:unnamed protein product [Aureobasidium pullulans]
MSAAARKNDTSLEAVEKRALFTHIYLVHLDQSRHDLYAIYHGFPAGVDMPSHLKLPSISGSDRDTKIEQQIPVYDVSSIDLSITTREEFERRLDFYWWR